MLAAFSLGLLSAFAVGPSGINLLRIRIWKSRFPRSELLGLLGAELFYFLLAWGFLLTTDQLIKNARPYLILISGFSLLVFSVRGLIRGKSAQDLSAGNYYEGFWPSLFLALSNPQILMLYLGLLSPLRSVGLSSVVGPVVTYFVSFLVPTVVLLRSLGGSHLRESKTVYYFEKIVFVVLASYAAYLLRSLL